MKVFVTPWHLHVIHEVMELIGTHQAEVAGQGTAVMVHQVTINDNHLMSLTMHYSDLSNGTNPKRRPLCKCFYNSDFGKHYGEGLDEETQVLIKYIRHVEWACQMTGRPSNKSFRLGR